MMDQDDLKVGSYTFMKSSFKIDSIELIIHGNVDRTRNAST